MSNFRPQVLAIVPGFFPSTHICIVKPLMQLHRAKLIRAKITLEYLANRRSLEWADLTVFCRNTEPGYGYIIDFLLSRNIPFIYDIDDNFFEVPLDSELGKYHRSPERLAMFVRYIESANMVRVYSRPLLERIRAYNPNVEKVVGPIDWSMISSPRFDLSPNTIKIIYATSRFNDNLAKMFMPALNRVLNQYGEKVEAHFWGVKANCVNGCHQVRYHSLIRDYDKFLHRFSQGCFDIGLAPLKDDTFHRSKTNNKFREYGACGIAGIYSDVDVYSSCVTDGETGLLVSNESESWHRAIVRLIEDHALREKIKRQAQEYVHHHYSEEDFEKVWWNQIQNVLAEDSRPSASITSVNVIPEWEEVSTYTKRFQESSRIAVLQKKGQNLIRHLRRDGVHSAIQLLRWKLYDLGMVLKLRFITSPAFDILSRKKPQTK